MKQNPWRFRQIFKVSQYLREGKSDEGIAKAIRTSRGAVFYLKKSVRNFRENDLGRILGLIEQTDYGIKNSSGNNYILLEKFLLGICARRTQELAPWLRSESLFENLDTYLDAFVLWITPFVAALAVRETSSLRRVCDFSISSPPRASE